MRKQIKPLKALTSIAKLYNLNCVQFTSLIILKFGIHAL